MKKTTLTLITFAFCGFTYAQDETPAKEKLDRTGDIIFEPTIGIPNAGSFLLMSANIFDNYGTTETVDNTSLPIQIGGRLEYMVSHRIGISIEGNFEKSGYDSHYTGTTYDNSTGTFKDTTYHTIYEMRKTRLLARFQFHPVQTEKVDLYVGAGLGMTLNKETNPQNQIDEFDTFFFPIILVDRATDPLAARIFFGTRVNFTPHIGMLVEVGMGSGSVLNLGINARF
jgi:opacity protein-like surface antigen